MTSVQAKGSQQASYNGTSAAGTFHPGQKAAEDDPEISDVSDDEEKPPVSDHRSPPSQHRESQPVKSEGPSHSGRHGGEAPEPPGPEQDDEPFDPRRFYEDSPRVSLPFSSLSVLPQTISMMCCRKPEA